MTKMTKILDKGPAVTRLEEIAAHHAATATSHLTQALHWYRFSLGIVGDRQLALAHCVELYAREAGRCARCAGQLPELWRERAPQAIQIHAIATAFFAGWQECDTFLTETIADSSQAHKNETCFSASNSWILRLRGEGGSSVG
jgi:hypothetical protein